MVEIPAKGDDDVKMILRKRGKDLLLLLTVLNRL
jgi:hypothetical protein